MTSLSAQMSGAAADAAVAASCTVNAGRAYNCFCSGAGEVAHLTKAHSTMAPEPRDRERRRAMASARGLHVCNASVAVCG